MAYIGNKPTVGNFQICDAISVVNGQAAYTMQVGSVNVSPQSANHMIVSLNGTIQKPNSSFTVSGAVITFSSNLVTNDVIDFIQILGDVLDIGVPSDATVTTAKLASTSVTAAKLNNDIISGTTALTSEPADTDEFLVSDAGTLKRIDYSLIKGGGAMTLLDTVSVTSGTIANITTGAIFSATYNSYRIMLDQFKHTEPSALYFQVGNASGLATSYNWSSIGLRETNVQNTAATGGGDIKLYGQDNSNDYKTNSNQGMPSGYIDLFNVYTTGNTHIQGRFTFGNATNNGAQNNVIGGIVLNTTQYDRYKISVSNGNIGATTKVRTYGFNI